MLALGLLAGLIGYLIGSISFSRVLISIRAPKVDATSAIEHQITGGDKVFVSSSTGATAARFQLGTKYGCLAAILDIFKAIIPTLIFRLWMPDEPYYLIAATMVIIGHNYPIYYGFKGGRGLSTIYGAFIVIDWLGVLLTNTIGLLLGGLLGQVLLMRWAGLVLMIPWIWFRTKNLTQLGFVLVANALFWIAMLPELRQYFHLRKTGDLPDKEEVAEFMGMGGVYRTIQRFNVLKLFRINSDDDV